jgi:hypothetical protein
MATLTLKRKINRKRRIIVKDRTATPKANTPKKPITTLKLKPSLPTKKDTTAIPKAQKPTTKLKPSSLTKEEKEALEIEHLRAEKEKRATIHLAEQKKVQETRRLAIRALNKKLNVYSVWHDCLPMQIGVKALILEKFKGNKCSNKAIRELIGKHCKRRKYLENIITQGQRHDLFTGKVVADITQIQKDKAQKLLDIFNKFLTNKS